MGGDMTDRIFATHGDWAVGADELQWILYRRRSRRLGGWTGVWFVRSTRDILAMGMRERGADDDTARLLLAGLPDTFDQWNRAASARSLAADALLAG